MTVSSTTSKASYSGNGSTTAFSVPFYFLDNTHIKVVLRDAAGVETVKTLTTDYTVTGAGVLAGGTVTMNTAPASGVTVVIARNVPLTQETDYQTNDPFPAETHERALDKLTMEVQQLKEIIDRAIKLSTTNTMGSTEFSVGATLRANKIFAFDSSGELTVAQEIGTYKGNWTSGATYAQRDLIKDTSNSNIYICLTGHTASGSQPISTNTDSAKWALLVDAAAAATSASAAAASASAAATSATSAANSATAATTNGAAQVTLAAAQVTLATTQATNAANSATAASGSASAASGSASAASSSASAASTSATNAANSATAASASAAAAAAAAASGLYRQVLDKSANYTILAADQGTLFRASTGSGAITFTLPQISSVTDGFKVAIVKWTSDGNQVNVSRAGSDTINGATSVQIGSQYSQIILVADFETNTWFASQSGLGATNKNKDRFSGNGSTTVFTLSADPGSQLNTDVYISGVHQNNTTYTVSGTTLTFSTAPASGTNNIEVVYGTPLAIGTPSDGTVTPAKLSTGGLFWDTSGNVGVGTTSPGFALDVQKASGDVTVRAKSNGGSGAGIFTADGNGAGSYPGYNIAQSGVNYWSLQQRGDTNLHIFRQSGSGDVLIEGGNLGIGTGSPAVKLDVSGTIATVADTNNYAILAGRYSSGFGSAAINTRGAYGIEFQTNGTAAVRYDGSGNFSFNSGYGSVATAYGCRAWANFAGSNGTRNGNGNVSSVTRNSTGNYTMNFSTAMPDTNYAAIGSYIGSNSNGVSCVSFASISTSSIVVISTTYAANTDATNIFVGIFR